MTAPVASARVDPSGRKYGDGSQTLVTFSADTNISLWEQSVTPPGLEADPVVDTSSMHNDAYRTYSPGSLIKMTEMTFSALWAGISYNEMAAIMNDAQTITCTFPDGATLAFYGVVTGFKPGAMERGKVPEATVTIMPTNQDPVTCNEEGPVFVAGSGTAPSC